jgi:ribokinase
MFQMGPGGKGANQCACAALLSGSSSNVAMIGAVGDDVFGSNYLTSFATSNVVIEGLVDIIPGISTGVAPITVDEKGENSIIVVPGANNRMTVSRTIEKLDSLPNLRCALFQLEIPNEVTLACMKRCIQRGIITFFTPAPVPPKEALQPEQDPLLLLFAPPPPPLAYVTLVPEISLAVPAPPIPPVPPFAVVPALPALTLPPPPPAPAPTDEPPPALPN